MKAATLALLLAVLLGATGCGRNIAGPQIATQPTLAECNAALEDFDWQTGTEEDFWNQHPEMVNVFDASVQASTK